MRLESARDLSAQFPDVDGFWNFDDLAATEVSIRGRLPAEASGPWTEESLGALTQLARLQALQGKLVESKATLEQADSFLPLIDPARRLNGEIRCELERGRWWCLSKMPAKAQSHFSRAWDLALQSERMFFAIDAAVMISDIQPLKQRPAWFRKALDLAEASQQGDGRLWLGQLYMLEGWQSFDAHRYVDALESFAKSLDHHQGTGDIPGVRVAKWSIGRTMRALGRHHEALRVQQEILEDLKREGQANGHVDLEIAECMQALRLHEEARPFYGSAHKLLADNAWYSDNHPWELKRIQKLSKG